jgi:hypothetical protein
MAMSGGQDGQEEMCTSVDMWKKNNPSEYNEGAYL